MGRRRTLGVGPLVSDLAVTNDRIAYELYWELGLLRLARGDRRTLNTASCEQLLELASLYLPPFCRLKGTDVVPDDLAIDDAVHDGEMLVQDDSSRARFDVVPRGYNGYLLRVSDHGNQSLYRVIRGRRYLVW